MKDRLSCAGTAALACVAAYAALGARSASAQAWVPDRGEINAGLDYNLAISSTTVTNTTEEFEDTGTTSHQVVLSGEYSPIQRLAIQAQLPFVGIKYTGTDLFAHGPWDDGKYHTSLTDFRAGARYQVLEDPVAISPHLAVSVPMQGYETRGNTVGGRNLKYLHLGLSAGYIIGEATYLHLLYEFSIGEKLDATPETEQHSQNRSDIGFTVGHVFNAIGLDAHLDVNYRMTHGGVSLSGGDFMALSMSERMYHDAILKEEILLIGGGVGYNISDSLAATLGVRQFITGKNTQNTTLIAAGISWAYR